MSHVDEGSHMFIQITGTGSEAINDATYISNDRKYNTPL